MILKVLTDRWQVLRDGDAVSPCSRRSWCWYPPGGVNPTDEDRTSARWVDWGRPD
jgi:hypothetical protein